MRKRFTPKLSVMSLFYAVDREHRADRIAGIRARLADGWRHMGWEQRLFNAEKWLRVNAPAHLRAVASRGEAGCSAIP